MAHKVRSPLRRRSGRVAAGSGMGDLWDAGLCRARCRFFVVEATASAKAVDDDRDLGQFVGERVIAGRFEGGGERQHRLAVVAGGGDDVDRRSAGCGSGCRSCRARRRARVPSASSAAPPLITNPAWVAAPIAANTVTGTAIANAHGDAATSTTSARSIHTPGSPNSDPTTAIDGGDDQDAGHQRAGDPVGEPLRAALAVLGFLDGAHDAGQRAVAGRRRGLDLEDAAAVDAAGEHPVADVDLDRDRLAGHRRHVERWNDRRRTTPSVGIRSPARNTITSPTTTSPVGTSTIVAARRTPGGVGHQRRARPAARAATW